MTLPALLAALLWAAAPGAAAESAPDAPRAAEEKAEQDAGPGPVATQEEILLVEGSLPYAPASNTIATKLPTELAWTPANVGVVGQPLLWEQGAGILGDALINVSGLNVQTGQGVFDFFVLRGFDSLTSGLVLTDGAPEPEATFYQLYNAERVEVLKGPAGFLYGSNPLAGAVNIVRKQPLPGSFAVAGAGAGSFGTAEGSLDWNAASRSGEVTFRLNGLWRESDGHRRGKASRVWAVNPAFAWRPSADTSLNLNLELATSEFTPDAGLPLLSGELPPVGRDQAYESPFDFSDQGLSRVQVDLEHRLSPRVTLRDKLYVRDLDWQSDGTLLFGVFPAPFFPGGSGFVVGRALARLDDRQRVVGNQLEAVIETRTGGVGHRLLAGVEVVRAEDDFTLEVLALPVVDLLAPVDSPNPPVFTLESAAGDSRTVVIAPYLVDELTLSERWRLFVGARFDAIDFEDPANDTSRSDGEVSPLLGVVFAPRSGLALYANAARSFAPPSPRVAGPREPEESRQLELGVRQELLGSRLHGTLALYRLERDSIAIPDDNGFTQQAGDQRSQGVELELAGDLAPGLGAVFTYAYTDSELTRFTELVSDGAGGFAVLDRTGNRSAFAPQHLARLWVSKRWRGPWGLAGGLRWVSDQFIAEDNVATIDGDLLADATVSYRRGDWRLRLDLDNLTDTDYETRAFGAGSVIPAAPFAARLSAEVRFWGG